MAAADYRGQVYTTLANAVANWAPVSSVIRTLVRFDDSNAELPPSTELGDGDFPRWILWPANGTDRGYTVTPGFGDNSPTFNPATTGWLSQMTDTYMLTLIHASRNAVAVYQLEEDVFTAIRALGPTLGLSSFVQFAGKMTVRRIFGVTDQTGGAERFETTFIIPVQMQFQGNTLLV